MTTNNHPIRAVIFDLDGVIVSTDEFHYQGWKRLADEERIPFDRSINDRLRGVSRMASLEILLERAARSYSAVEKDGMCDRKNNYYKQLITRITPADLLPGALDVVNGLKACGVKVAIASSSKNAPTLMKLLGLEQTFDAVIGGSDIVRTKPHPEVFLLAAKRVGVPPLESLVVEDAVAGLEGAFNAGMRVLAVGDAGKDPRATARAVDLSAVSVAEVLAIGASKTAECTME